MKIPEIISDLKSMLAGDCLTAFQYGRVLCVNSGGGFEFWSLILYAERKLGRSLRDHWGVNYMDMDHAIYGDVCTRRQKWIRAWLLRELGLSRHSGSKEGSA